MKRRRKLEIKQEDVCLNLVTGHRGRIGAIQYVHNRYQFTDVSGWQYDIENLVIVPHTVASAIDSTEIHKPYRGLREEERE